MSYETKALNKISQALGGQAKVQKNEILNEIAGNVGNISGAEIHICTSGEYDPETGLPTISSPDETTFYLVPGGENNNVYNEYIYANNKWELFGSYDIDPGYKVTNKETSIYSGNVEVSNPFNGTYKSNKIIESSALTSNSITAVFNGTEYKVKRGEFYGNPYYGEPFQGYFAFTTYPFSVADIDGTGFVLATKDQGTYNLEVTAVAKSYTLSDDFDFVLSSIVPKNVKDYGSSGIVENDLTNNVAGVYAHAEGQNTKSSGSNSHTEGGSTTASGFYSHAEGQNTTASGNHSHTEGGSTTASGNYSHAEGSSTTASGNRSHAEGGSTNASGDYSHAEGNGSPSSVFYINGKSYIPGAYAQASHTEGERTVVPSDSHSGCHAEGVATIALSSEDGGSHAEGYSTSADGSASHSEGKDTRASGKYSHAEGYTTKAQGVSSHAEGDTTTASGNYSHAEGQNATASDAGSHAEGYGTTASGSYSHAEGHKTTASGGYSHAEGQSTTASGSWSHAEGNSTTVSGYYSHAEGQGTIAAKGHQHVFGMYNIEDTTGSFLKRGSYVEIVGNGTDDSARSNARTLDWSGNEALAGSLTLGKGSNDETTITAAQLKSLLGLLTEQTNS